MRCARADGAGHPRSASGGGAEPAVVKIAGPHEQGAKAKAAVGDIAKYYHSAATHPGVTHLEYAVPEEHMGQFRGRGSANIRHVQSDSKASVNVPKAWSLNQNVVVVGTAHEVSIAKKHIDKILQQIKDEEEKRERELGPPGALILSVGNGERETAALMAFPTRRPPVVRVDLCFVRTNINAAVRT